MASTRNNCITRGSSGKIGQVVLTIDGQMRSRSDTSKRVLTPLQKKQVELFEKAKDYARMVIYDEKLNDFYAKKAARKHGLGAWHLAIRDYCHPCEITSTIFENFTGKCGDVICIGAYDEFGVTEVMVVITSGDGLKMQEGFACSETPHVTWQYVLSSDIELAAGVTITFKAKDIPGNVTSVTLNWPFDCNKTIHFRSEKQQGLRKKYLKSQLRTRKV